VTFDVDTASVVIDGTPAAASELRLGMVVEVRGTVDARTATGVAASVEFDDDLQGPVEAVDESQSTIVVLGQLVFVTEATVFDARRWRLSRSAGDRGQRSADGAEISAPPASA
jgi:hypothetical protein